MGRHGRFMRPSGRRGRTAGRVCGSLAEIRMPPVAEVFAATDAVGSGKVCQVVAPFVEAYVTMMSSPVFAPVGKVMMRTGKIEMIVVGIDHADPQDPPSGVHVDGTEKVFGLHETVVLPAAQHPAQVIVSHVQIHVITVHGTFVAGNGQFHQPADPAKEVIVNLKHIVTLTGGEIQLVCHLISQKTAFHAQIRP